MRFNDDIRANFDFCSSRDGVQVNNKNFSQAIKQAAEKFLTKIPTEQKQAYLSEATWGLIENRQVARAQSNSDLEQQLNAAIKRSARCDKKKWKLRMLEDVSSARAKWKGIKLEKSTFKPSFYKLKNIHGQSVPLDKKADALAEYLEQRHWACIQHLPPDKVDKREVVDTQPPINIGSITIEEIHDALRSSKTNKTPGPDGLTI